MYLIGAENPEVVNKAFGALVDRAQDLAWVAGLVEGEGCFAVEKISYEVAGRMYLTFRGGFYLNMTDYDVMKKASEILGLKLNGPYNRVNKKRKDGGECKPYWRIETRKQSKVREICELLYPYMGERRRSKIREVLAVLDDKDEQRRNRELAKDKGSL